ncbi:MAG: arsenate reductase (glutaredoxin) [Burkholderiaceae bacterium]
MLDVTIYHNPGCGTCRETLSILREKGVEPRIVEYMTEPLSRATLETLISAMGLRPRDLLREKDPQYETLDLANPRWSDSELVGFMVESPSLINRPIVATPTATRLCRPPITVLELLA